MAQAGMLVDVLKRALKANGLTYANVARGLGLSEPTVKRMFSKRVLTVQRLEAVCQLMDMPLTDLLRLLEGTQQRVSRLSWEQEEELARNDRLLLVAVCVNDHWTFEEIVKYYDISETECIRLLGLIELLPHNRIKRLVTPDFRWMPDGPIERYFEEKVLSEFLQDKFREDGMLRLYLRGTLSKVSTAFLVRKLERLAADFQGLQRDDVTLPLSQRHNVGLVLAMRPWELAVFKAMRR